MILFEAFHVGCVSDTKQGIYKHLFLLIIEQYSPTHNMHSHTPVWVSPEMKVYILLDFIVMLAKMEVSLTY